MMTDLGVFTPAADSARKMSGNDQPVAVPIAANVPMRRISRRDIPSQNSPAP
jgi:hypothetical protein